MEKTTSFQLSPSLLYQPFTYKSKTSNSIFHVLGVADVSSMEKPSSSSPSHQSSLKFSSNSYALNDAVRLNSLGSCKMVHAQIIKTADEWNAGSSLKRLFNLYAELGDFRSAAGVLFMGFERDPPSWSSWVEEFANSHERLYELLEIFRELHRRGLISNAGVLTAILRLCVNSMDSMMGLVIHACAFKSGFDSYAYLKSALMEFYASFFGESYANKIFSETCMRNTILWNKVIMLNAQSGSWLKVLELFHEMQFSGTKADRFTIAKVLQACGRAEALKGGKQIHGYVIRSLQMSDLLICNSLISMYSKNSKLKLARMVFDLMESRSLVSWNSIISGYALNGFLDEAWHVFDQMNSSEIYPDIVTWNCLISGHSIHGSHNGILQVLRRMQVSGLKPNSNSMTSALQGISEMGSLKTGKEIHGYLIRNELECDIFVGTSLVDMYIKKGCLTSARSVFDKMNNRNIFAWNSLISGYAYNGLFNEALWLLDRMEKEGIKPDLITWNGLISGYAMRGLGKKALVLIRQLKTLGSKANVVSWTALISGCSQTGNYMESLALFIEMQQEGIRPNSATIACLLRACTDLALLQKGEELHCHAIRSDFDKDIIVATALVDMYCKSGSLQHAHKVFRNIKNKNLASWNSMIMGFAVHGLGKEAISLFSEMCESGIHPDGITFTAVLSGCRHSGLFDEGWKYFDSMTTEYGITPRLEHYACMVDLLGRGGYLDEAWDFIQTMPLEPDAGVWGALLGACKLHKNLELAEIGAKYLFELEPYNSGNYLLMMNLYAAENRWKDVENLKEVMTIVGARTRPGWSWIQIGDIIHVFSVKGEPHPEIGEIYFELYQLISKMKKLGYVPDTECVPQNLNEEEKEKALLSHTEKLAITYGLINAENGVPVRVIKNSRVCNDCHTVAKYMSQISSREIVLRDGVRFHHFVGGKCSCNDYW